MHAFGDHRRRKDRGLVCRVIGLAVAGLEARHCLEQRRIIDPTGKVQFGKQMSQIPFERRRQGGVEGPLTADLVERHVAQVVGDQREAGRGARRLAAAPR